MEFTEQEFNLAMAELDGYTEFDDAAFFAEKLVKIDGYWMALPDYYFDLNQLMPITWKHAIQEIVFADDFETYDEWINGIRDRLYQIYLEGYSDE